MIVTLTTIEYDPLGLVQVRADPASKSEVFSRRLTRTATLDGESSISDMGYTASDATLQLVISRITREISDRLEYLVQTYPLLHMSINNAVYEGAMDQLDTALLPVKFNFIVKRRLV